MKILLLIFAIFSWAGLEGRPPLKNTIVLVHGATMGGSKLKIGPLNFGDYFRGIPELYKTTKTDVRIAEQPTDSSIGERAALLKNYLETDLKGKKVNIIAHSLGGLDARYLVSILKSDQVVSITTIGTPHLGTPLADWAVKQTKEQTLWYKFFKLLGFDMKQRRFLFEITTKSMQEKFNDRVIDSPKVKYFSVQTKASFSDFTMSFMLWFPARWLESEHNGLAAMGHDGLVPLVSQTWGEEIATLELDHLAQINHHEFRKNNEKESLGMYSLIYDRLLGAGL